MNKINKQLVPICFLTAIIVFALIVFTFVKNAWEEYTEAKELADKSTKELKTLEEQFDKTQQLRDQNEMKLRSIKQIYQSNLDSENENLGMFGTMFEDIIKRIQYNGLLIRSIEYDMHPATDAVFSGYSDEYNVCELKFFLVGSYAQLQAFLSEMNNNFEYLISFSKMNVTAFTGNPDYIIANISITLYSKKPSKQ